MKFILGFPLTLLLISIFVMPGDHKVEASSSKEFTVGGKLGWRVPDKNDTEAYNHWAETRRFHIGDTLRFVYTTNDSVLEVDKYDYYHCKTGSPLATYNDGNTTVELSTSGLVYFISGSADNCAAGQRLIVDVMSSHTHISSPPTSSDDDDEDHHSGGASAPHHGPATSAADLMSTTAVVSAFAVGLGYSLLLSSVGC